MPVMVSTQLVEIDEEGRYWLFQDAVYCADTGQLVHMPKTVAHCQARSSEWQVKLHQAAANTGSEELQAFSCSSVDALMRLFLVIDLNT
ncbi:hypothetical protein ABBQ38_007595 [Trebouxia sp. C0009 RCD-2024]